MIDLLAKPIVDLLGAFGSGVIPSGGPADVIRASSRTLDTVERIGTSAVSELASAWSGPAAAAATELAGAAATSAIQLADHGTDIAAVVDRACEKVQAGVAELQAIVQSFVSIAVASAPVLATPAGQSMLITAAIEHLERALAVVGRVRGELDVHAAEITGYAAPPSVPQPAGVHPASTVPAAAASPGADPGAQFVRNFAQSVSSSAPSVMPDHASSIPTMPAAVAPNQASSPQGMSMYAPQRESAEVGTAGRGVEVALPDGSVAVAPNEQAAGAVRSALSQQGTPYVWGGNEPGRGLDCSGLTQWAYAEQGVELPRLAQEQDIGAPVDDSEVMPGDLAVWDGHVAMVIGNGQFVEAGDPVQVSEIRTTNSGMGFKGFYRPTA
ncbi:C40 family peptidase [Rhodococcoides yunnanense]|uniref:C40 family peptidase n=1 Tax=Rhodococcoides yunnanense TaxID=278209 RepID=UPI0009322E03|nr:C40 family peptidase [Rhodococcus yunnanensis]